MQYHLKTYGILLAMGVSGAACQTYTPIQARPVAPGTTVRVTMSPDEAARQAGVVGELTNRLEGRVADSEADVLALTIPSRGATPAARRFNTFVTLPWEGVVEVHEKRFSLGRSIALAAIGAVATVAILAVADNSGGGDGEPPNNNSDRRLIDIRIGW